MRGALLAATLAACVATARAEPASLATAVDALQRAQAGIAAGDAKALAETPRLLTALGASLAAATPAARIGSDYASAALIYLLSGGAPAAFDKSPPDARDNLLRGALAFAQGRPRDALALIGAVDPRGLDARAAGHFAYALAVLAATSEPQRALGLLDLARLLAPGGLVEETALRREMLLAGQLRDAPRFAALARRYLQRFPHSLYAGPFMASFAATILRLHLAEDQDSLATFERAAAAMDLDRRRAFELALARGELEDGRFELAGEAAGVVLRETSDQGQERQRAQFYAAAALVISERSDDGVAALRDIAPARLEPADRALLGALRALAAHLRDAPPAPASEPSPDEATGAEATIRTAEDALARTVALTTGAP